MIQKWAWVLFCLTTAVLDDVSSGSRSDTSFLEPLAKHYSSTRSPRTVRWTYHPQEDSSRHASQGISHGYASHPQESALKSTESLLEHFNHPSTSPEYWRPSTADSNFTGVSYYGYSRTHLGLGAAASGSPYQDSKQGSYAAYRFQQSLPAVGAHVAVKKIPTYHPKGNVQVQGFDVYGKSKYKKTNFRQSAVGHKKLVYPRVHKPYVKHKYPTRKTLHPLYKRYYRSPYQRYEIPSREMSRYKISGQSEALYAASTTPPSSQASAPNRYHYTTERMDDAYPEGSSTSEDYSAYGYADQKSSGNYYETYEEVEKTTLEPEESSYEETTTRGYYGDRIYMSTQVPHTASDKSTIKNKYFLVRRTSGDDDIETIFE